MHTLNMNFYKLFEITSQALSSLEPWSIEILSYDKSESFAHVRIISDLFMDIPSRVKRFELLAELTSNHPLARDITYVFEALTLKEQFGVAQSPLNAVIHAKEPVAIRHCGNNMVIMSEQIYDEFRNEIQSLQRRLLGMSQIVEGKTKPFVRGENRLKRFQDSKPAPIELKKAAHEKLMQTATKAEGTRVRPKRKLTE